MTIDENALVKDGASLTLSRERFHWQPAEQLLYRFNTSMQRLRRARSRVVALSAGATTVTNA